MKAFFTKSEYIQTDLIDLKYTPHLKIVQNPETIIKLIQKSTNLPVWKELNEFIIYDINYFKAKSLIFKKFNKVIGHTLIFNLDNEVLYFGFFRVLRDKKKYIKQFITLLIEYAIKMGFKLINGPINIPTIIFGWGFMEKGSATTNFIHKPVISPNYLELFIKKGFNEQLKEYSYEGIISEDLKKKLGVNKTSKYEAFNFEDWDSLFNFKHDFLELNARNLPKESVITPNIDQLFDNYFNFIKKYGYPFMFTFLREVASKKTIGCLFGIPNPFRKNKQMIYDSTLILSFVVDKEYRDKQLTGFLINNYVDKALEHNITYAATTLGSHAWQAQKVCESLGLINSRTHVTLTLTIKS